MKQVHVCSLKEFQWKLRNNQIQIEESYALISSSYELGIHVPMCYSFECYDDIDRFVLGRTFTYEGAKRFAKTVKDNTHIQHWWCVCDGGQSRSAATACALLRFFGNENDEFKIWKDPHKSPNPLVYEMLCKALGTPVDVLDLDLRIYENRAALKNALQRNQYTE